MLKKLSPYFMGGLYILAGLNHFITPEFYIKIIPDYLPFPVLLVYLSGVAEIALGILLLFQKTRRLSALLIMTMLMVFLIVHIQMLIDYIKQHDPLLWLAVIRIPLQFVLIWWGWRVMRITRSTVKEE